MNRSQIAIDIIQKELIRPRMEELGISIYRLAELTNINRSHLGRWLKGNQDITLTKFIDILYALGINPEFVLKELEQWDGKDWKAKHEM